MTAPLPFLLSIPHGGETIPNYLHDCVALSHGDVLEDGDAYTGIIFNLGKKVYKVIQADIARAIVDLNRDVTELPPKYPDGLIKEITCYKKRVYLQGKFPSMDIITRLIKEYYHPYHHAIQKNLYDRHILMAFDCHSMANTAPPIEKDVGCQRPWINLGNDHGKACHSSITERLSLCFREVFQLSPEQVTVNMPFSGGFITRTYGMHPIPWIQIEINRSLYLCEPWFDRQSGDMDKDCLQDLNTMILEVFTRFYKYLSIYYI